MTREHIGVAAKMRITQQSSHYFYLWTKNLRILCNSFAANEFFRSQGRAVIVFVVRTQIGQLRRCLIFSDQARQ